MLFALLDVENQKAHQTLQPGGPDARAELCVPGAGIEPATRGFSVPCSTTELPRRCRAGPWGAARAAVLRSPGRRNANPRSAGRGPAAPGAPDAALRRGRAGARSAADARAAATRARWSDECSTAGCRARPSPRRARSCEAHAIADDALVPLAHLLPEPDARLVHEEPVLEVVEGRLEVPPLGRERARAGPPRSRGSARERGGDGEHDGERSHTRPSRDGRERRPCAARTVGTAHRWGHPPARRLPTRRGTCSGGRGGAAGAAAATPSGWPSGRPCRPSPRP